MKKGTVLIIAVAVFVLFSVLSLAACGTKTFNIHNGKNIGQAIKTIANTTGLEAITLNEIVPFEWEAVYSFSPYTPKQEMENIIGFKSKHITETVSEGMTQLIFVMGNKVVCNICGYSDNLGYSISLWSGDERENYARVRYEDNVIFSVERKENVVVLSRLPN